MRRDTRGDRLLEGFLGAGAVASRGQGHISDRDSTATGAAAVGQRSSARYRHWPFRCRTAGGGNPAVLSPLSPLAVPLLLKFLGDAPAGLGEHPEHGL